MCDNILDQHYSAYEIAQGSFVHVLKVYINPEWRDESCMPNDKNLSTKANIDSYTGVILPKLCAWGLTYVAGSMVENQAFST